MLLQGLPTELQAHIALFAGKHGYSHVRTKLGDMLSLRLVSKASLEAVGRAAHNHPSCVEVRFEERHYKAIPLRAIQTYGRVFGSGCREFDYCGPYRGPHNHVIVPHIRNFIASHTQGRLLKLYFHRSSISEEALLEICRACPLLKDLEADREVPNLEPIKSHMLEFASELSRACPLLDNVSIPKDSSFSKAETYSMHFPQTRCLDFRDIRGGHIHSYKPSRLDQIEASAQCVGVKRIDLSWCRVSSPLVELFLRSPLRGRVMHLDLSGGTQILPETILQCVVGFEVLKEVAFPSGFHGSPEFYTRIAQARPSLNDISLGENSYDDDSCVAALCNKLALEYLSLNGLNAVTPAIVDVILQSKTAMTLSFLSVVDAGTTQLFTSAGLLRLVRGCPKLCAVHWEAPTYPPNATFSAFIDGDNVDEVNKLLTSRCQAHPDPDWTWDEECDAIRFPEYHPGSEAGRNHFFRETRTPQYGPSLVNRPSVFAAPGGGY